MIDISFRAYKSVGTDNYLYYRYLLYGMENDRMIKGYSILAKGDMPTSVNKETFLIPSQSGNGKYKVTLKNSWSCTCPDFKFRNVECKHICSVKLWLKLRQKINSQDTLELENELTNEPKCAYCDSLNVKKNGNRKTKNGTKQRFYCEDCKKTFIADEDFAKFKANPKIITLVMDLYYKGLSLRDITDTVYQFYNIKLHHETVRRWIMKFTVTMNNYVNQLQPKVSDAWHVDEQMIKVKGKWLWSWNCLDEQTRFLIANNITNERTIPETREILAKAKETTKTKPEFIITDGLQAYRDAVLKEFQSWRKPVVSHVRLETIRERPNNNLVERFHGTFRERDKVMRGFKSKTTAKELTEGFRTYYNFIRPHMSLNGLTPSQVADIDLQLGRNRWLSLLEKSLNSQI
jgi:transposase-like protein